MKAFAKDDVIVREDLTYPEGGLVVDGHTEEGYVLAHPLGGGLQLILAPEEANRFEPVEAAERIPVFSPGAFCLEGIDGDFSGWSDGTSWNGWEKPCFSREVAERVLQSSGYDWSYDAASDEFVVYSLVEDGPERFTSEFVKLGDGGTVKAYFVGAGSWIWDRV